MVTVSVADRRGQGTDRIADAVMWCVNHFDKQDWSLNNHWPAGYTFSFKNPADATHFALKWA